MPAPPSVLVGFFLNPRLHNKVFKYFVGVVGQKNRFYLFFFYPVPSSVGTNNACYSGWGGERISSLGHKVIKESYLKT